MARYPHIALVVSCRDTYRDLVLEDNEGTHYIRRTHPGFAEREVEATQRYFEHYCLEAPKIPFLMPEFTLPLFLRLYCESLSQADTDPIPTGHQDGSSSSSATFVPRSRRLPAACGPGPAQVMSWRRQRYRSAAF